jgi:hypothetical protein
LTPSNPDTQFSYWFASVRLLNLNRCG